jgi:MGT family glycosyltransferase
VSVPAGKDPEVRILFTFVGGRGHLDPLVPVARAAEAAGHTVAVTGRPAMIGAVQAAGLTGFSTGADLGPPARVPLRRLSSEREDRVVRDSFAGWQARERVTAILALCAAWRPDLLVCDEVDFGGMVAAERLGLPYATVVVIAAGSFVRRELLAEPLNALRAEHGLPPDPDLAMLDRHLVLAAVPASFRDPGVPLPATAHLFRPPGPEPAGDQPAPPWPAGRPGAATVYVTLGTVFNLESGDLFQRVLAGLRDLPVDLVVTVGPHMDPAELGPQPANVHVERYLPQALVLPHCRLVVSHGGSGSVLGALAHGLPMVLVPMGADQPHNAARCRALGVARVLDAVDATPRTVGAAAAAVLTEPSYRRAAERLRDEIAALPGPASTVPLLERLAATRRPLRRGRRGPPAPAQGTSP